MCSEKGSYPTSWSILIKWYQISPPNQDNIKRLQIKRARLPTQCLLTKRVPKGTAASPANKFIMTNRLCYPTPLVKSFRPDFSWMADCCAVNLTGLHSRSEWSIKKTGVLLPPFSQYLQSPLVQDMDLNLPLKSAFTRKNAPLPKKALPSI